MGLGENAPVTASHLLMIVMIAVTIGRLMWLINIPRLDVGFRVILMFLSALCMLLFALGVERFYYVMARTLAMSGVNLWAAHPAPAVLSGLVALSVLWLSPVIWRALGYSLRATWLGVAAEVTGYTALWFTFMSLLK